MDVVVFGAGSLGSLVGGLLAREHAVTLVGRDPHVTAVRESGLAIEGELTATVHPAAATAPPAAADLAVVTVKAFDVPDAADELAGTELKTCLPLTNGLGAATALADRLDCPVLAGTCTYGARLTEPGRVACTGVGRVTLGERAGGASALADRVGAAFAAAGLETEVATDMPVRVWEKLAVNAGINATTALAGVPNGALLDGPLTGTAEAAARETARVADVALDPDAAADRLRAVARETAANTSSMRRDVASGRRTEVDAINGYVLDRATEPVPVNATLAGLVRGWEAQRGLR